MIDEKCFFRLNSLKNNDREISKIQNSKTLDKFLKNENFNNISNLNLKNNKKYISNPGVLKNKSNIQKYNLNRDLLKKFPLKKKI